jgi:DNA-binding IclR family transcriptional regulator
MEGWVMVARRRSRLEILDVLRLHHEQSGQGLDVNSLAERLGEPTEAVKSACDALEDSGFVEKVGMSGDSNPTYSISRRGLAYLRVLS